MKTNFQNYFTGSRQNSLLW